MRDMDYTSLFKNNGGKKSKVGIIGATRGYGYTLLAQIPKVELMELRLISSRHTDECVEVLTGLDLPMLIMAYGDIECGKDFDLVKEHIYCEVYNVKS